LALWLVSAKPIYTIELIWIFCGVAVAIACHAVPLAECETVKLPDRSRVNLTQYGAVIPVWPAVNFGIRLRGRTPQQIAELILQALGMRITGMKATTAPAAIPLVDPATTPSQPPPVSTPPPSSDALAIWKEKLDYLQQQEAISADPAHKFALKKQIEEAEDKIREMGG
jgi:hypothetical protein